MALSSRCKREQSAQLCYPLRHAETRDLPGCQYLRADRAAQNARLEARRCDRAQHAHGGQQTPILVRADGTRFVLVEGLHRLEAAKALGEATIVGYRVEARKH